jgi:hypothetical protein
LFLIGCGGGGGGDGGDDDPGADAPPACSPVDGALLAPAATILDAAVAPDGALVALVRDTSGVALLRDGIATPVTAIADEASLALDAAGRACIAYRVNSEMKTYAACEPDLTARDTALDPALRRPHLVHHEQLCVTLWGGCGPFDSFTLFFQDDFSSAAAANGTPAEGWTPEELFLSSGTGVTDTTQIDGQGYACMTSGFAAALLGHHPYRGDLDDIVSWPLNSGDCQIAARGREVALAFGRDNTMQLARWEIPLLPTGPWPEPAAAAPIALPAEMFNATFDLAATAGGYELAYAARDGGLHVLAFDGQSWTEQAAPAVTTFARPHLLRGGGSRHLLVSDEAGVRHWRSCE